MIEIDGSVGEGGGQVLRTSLALAAVLRREVRVFNIRAGRVEPGLKAQHLTGAKALTQICSASSKGLQIGSTDFTFSPGALKAGFFRFDVGTAGSITLVLQTLMPLLPFAPGTVELEITGGTDVKWSPPVDYLRLVTLPLLDRMDMHASILLVKRGHYPKGGGFVRLKATPTSVLKNIVGIDTGNVTAVTGISHSVKLPRRVDSGGVLGGDSLGERGRPAEVVGEDAARKILEEIGSSAFLDRHMGDMIVPYLALAVGVSDVSVSQVTMHTLTNVKVAEQVAGVRFDSLPEIGMPGKLRVKGLGLRREEVSVSPRE